MFADRIFFKINLLWRQYFNSPKACKSKSRSIYSLSWYLQIYFIVMCYGWLVNTCCTFNVIKVAIYFNSHVTGTWPCLCLATSGMTQTIVLSSSLHPTFRLFPQMLRYSWRFVCIVWFSWYKSRPYLAQKHKTYTGLCYVLETFDRFLDLKYNPLLI